MDCTEISTLYQTILIYEKHVLSSCVGQNPLNFIHMVQPVVFNENQKYIYIHIRSCLITTELSNS